MYTIWRPPHSKIKISYLCKCLKSYDHVNPLPWHLPGPGQRQRPERPRVQGCGWSSVKGEPSLGASSRCAVRWPALSCDTPPWGKGELDPHPKPGQGGSVENAWRDSGGGRWRLQWAVVCTLAAWGIRVPRGAWRAIEHVPSWKAHNQGAFRPDEETLRKRRGIVLGKRETGRRWKGPARECQEIIQGRGPYWASLQSLLRCPRRASVWRSAWQRATRCCRENCKQHRLDEEDFAFFL